MESAHEVHLRNRLAQSILSHKEQCDQCRESDQKAIAALEGVPYDVLVREAG